MYCPQCGTESGTGLQFCRSCGANLKVIGKALTLSEAIARSDRGPLPKLKEMVKSLKVEHVTEEVSRALERMNKEIMRTSHAGMVQHGKPWWPFEIEPLVRILWLLGLVPMLSGAGHILAGLLINPLAGAEFGAGAQISTSQPSAVPEQPAAGVPPVSITEHTTNLLDPLPSSREEH